MERSGTTDIHAHIHASTVVVRAQVRALGALLTYLQSSVFSVEASGLVDVSSVRQLNAAGYMRVDAMTLR